MRARAVVVEPDALGAAIAMSAPVGHGFERSAGPGGSVAWRSSAKGRIMWQGVAPAGADAVAVPVLAGPRARGVTVTLRAGGRVVRMQPRGADAWLYWRAPLPHGGPQTVEIIAVDTSAHRDAWLAVATPRVTGDTR
jgi:hypothetical protein